LNRKLIEALKELEKEKGIKMDTIIDALKGALSASYKKIYDADYRVRIDIDDKSGEIKVYKLLEDETDDGEGNGGEIEITPEDFGRITAQTAKQVIRQRIKEAEREIMFDEFKDRVGDLVT